MATLRELARQILDGESIQNAGRIYSLQGVTKYPDGTYKAIIISERMRYSHAESAYSELDAIYMAFTSLQMMGRFMSYQSDDQIAKQNKTLKQKTHQPKPTKTPQVLTPTSTLDHQVSDADGDDDVVSGGDNPTTPDELVDASDPMVRERSIILRIVSRTK